MKLALYVLLVLALEDAAVHFPRDLKAKDGERKCHMEELRKELEAADIADEGKNVTPRVKRQLGYFLGNQGYGGYGSYGGYGGYGSYGGYGGYRGYGNRGSSESFESGERGGYRRGYYPGFRYGSSESFEG